MPAHRRQQQQHTHTKTQPFSLSSWATCKTAGVALECTDRHLRSERALLSRVQVKSQVIQNKSKSSLKCSRGGASQDFTSENTSQDAFDCFPVLRGNLLYNLLSHNAEHLSSSYLIYYSALFFHNFPPYILFPSLQAGGYCSSTIT